MTTYTAATPLSALPGPGDTSPPDCGNVNIGRLRAQIDTDLRHALIRGHYVDWGHGAPHELAADAVRSASIGHTQADAAWVRLMQAQENGAPDAEVLTLWRRWWAVSRAVCVDDLVDCALDGRRVAFPERAR